MRLLLSLLGLCALCAAASGANVEQKCPKRSSDAVRKATVIGLHGYQGKSVTKDAPPKQPKKPIAAHRGWTHHNDTYAIIVVW